jgi:hypothetical protein
MSLFVADLALSSTPPTAVAKLGFIGSSAVAGLIVLPSFGSLTSLVPLMRAGLPATKCPVVA